MAMGAGHVVDADRKQRERERDEHWYSVDVILFFLVILSGTLVPTMEPS